MVTFAQLRDLKCSEFEEAANAWGAVSNQANAFRERVDHQIIAKLQSEQGSEAAEEATKRLKRLSRNYQYINVECGLIRTALNGLATELAGSQRRLRMLLEEAAGQKCTILDDGSVQSQDQQPTPVDRNAVRAGDESALRSPQAKTRDIAERLGAILSDATEIDARYTKTLNRLRTNGDLTITTPMWDDALNDMNAVRKTVGDQVPADAIPQEKSPQENADWWKSLTQEEQDQYVSIHPASIGALDGIPTEVRDQANRTVLVESYGDTKVTLAAHMHNEPGKYTAYGHKDGAMRISDECKEWDAERKEMEGQMKGMEAIQRRFDRTGIRGLPEAYLLSYSPEGNGRAIIANNNPDDAAHTAVYVPGTGSGLEDAKTQISRMNELWRETQSVGPGSDVSTVTWIGYDAPQSAVPIVDGDLIPEAQSTSYAHDSAPTLNQFMKGLETAQGGADNSHTTLIGHSYGSTGIGAASLQGDLAADDIVAVGSPGMLVGHADELDVDKGHVWSQAAPAHRDQVPAAGKIAGLGGDEGGWENFLKDVLPFGYLAAQNVPSDEEFGANIMATDAKDHGDYWRRESVSIKNQAKVVLKDYENVDRG